MRTMLAWMLLLTTGVCQAIAADAPDGFRITGYRLAFVHVDKSGAITNEYVPRGETLENWTTLIGVRVWPQAAEVAEISGPYIRQLEPVMVRAARAIEPEGSTPGTDVVFELYLAPADKSYLEYNLIRFVREQGVPGVKSYQFAERRPYDLDAAEHTYAKRRDAWLSAIATLRLAAETAAIAEEATDVEASDDVATADDDDDSASEGQGDEDQGDDDEGDEDQDDDDEGDEDDQEVDSADEDLGAEGDEDAD